MVFFHDNLSSGAALIHAEHLRIRGWMYENLQRWLQCRPGGAVSRHLSMATSSPVGHEAPDAYNPQWQCEVHSHVQSSRMLVNTC